MGSRLMWLVSLAYLFVWFQLLIVVVAVGDDNEVHSGSHGGQQKLSIAVFMQLGMTTTMTSNVKLMQCVDSLAKAKRRSQHNSDFHMMKSRLLPGNSNNDHPIDNFSVDLYLSISNVVESRTRVKILADLKKLSLFDNIYSSVAKHLTTTVDVDYKLFIQQMAVASLHSSYELVLKLGSKSNARILDHSVECLCGTPSQVLSILHQFSSQQNTQLLVPHGLAYSPFTPPSDIFPPLLQPPSAPDRIDIEQFRSTAFNNETLRAVDQLYNYLFKKNKNKNNNIHPADHHQATDPLQVE